MNPCPWCGKELKAATLELNGKTWPLITHRWPWQGEKCPGPTLNFPEVPSE